MENKDTIFKNTINSIFSDSINVQHMKRSPSELALEEFIASEYGKKMMHHKSTGFNDHHNEKKSYTLCSNENWCPLEAVVTNSIEFDNVPLPINSQSSSVYVDSPISVNNSKLGDSSHEQLSDEDDQEDIEAGPCEQSANPDVIKRMRRMKSNRDSARRSRRRKQAYLSDLQQQVEQLQGESVSLFKQLAHATQQFKDSTTNNRVLRSDVEALRAKVKLAEDLVARGSLTSSLSHLLKNYLNTAHDHIDITDLGVTDHRNNIITPSGAHKNSQYNNVPTNESVGFEIAKAKPEPKRPFNSNDVINNGALDPEIWGWESLISPPVSK